jgi:hypothetical protein
VRISEILLYRRRTICTWRTGYLDTMVIVFFVRIDFVNKSRDGS